MNHSFEDVSACRFCIETCTLGYFHFDYLSIEQQNGSYAFILNSKAKVTRKQFREIQPHKTSKPFTFPNCSTLTIHYSSGFFDCYCKKPFPPLHVFKTSFVFTLSALIRSHGEQSHKKGMRGSLNVCVHPKRGCAFRSKYIKDLVWPLLA